jgi:hypothetical protein
MKQRLHILAALALLAIRAGAQFSGGVAFANSGGNLTQSNCTIPGQVFYGGVADGQASGDLIQSTCALPGQVFYGGVADGQASGNLGQSTCALPGQVFYGGVADGQATGNLGQSNCAIPGLVFYGGVADGQATGNLGQSNCAIPGLVFYGGVADGQATGNLGQSTCAIPGLVFYGGVADGHAARVLVQNNCIATDQIFYGGRADGSALRILKQGDCLTLLPVELLHFTAECGDGGVQLTWATATELNNDRFTVERSDDGLAFDEVGQVPGAGNSVSTLHYELLDDRPSAEGAYYRLKQTDHDGTDHYHSVVYIQCDAPMVQAPVVFPNPTDGPFRVTGIAAGQYLIITNSSGEVVFRTTVSDSSMDLSLAGRACGTYLLIIRDEHGRGSAQRVVLQR